MVEPSRYSTSGDEVDFTVDLIFAIHTFSNGPQ